MKRLILAGAALTALTSASYAADPAEVFAPVDVWSGWYVGVQGGYGFDGEVEYDDVSGLMIPQPATFDIDGWNGGLFYGRNWQSGNLVFGLDGSISFADMDGVSNPPGDPLGVTIEAFSASRLRVGYAFDNFLIYAAGGFSLAMVDVDFGGLDSGDDFLKGFTVGAGAEFMISESWSARVEYLYFDYGDETVRGDTDNSIEANIEADMHVVRAGIAYHF